jgi:DNA-binding MarR family transcriptional regulator
MDRTTLTRNLKPLIIAGYLNSSEGEDRRRRMISLTPAGDNIHKKAVPIWQEIQTQVTDALGQERWTRLLGDLHRVTRLA